MNHRVQKELEKWAEGKPRFLALLALYVMPFANRGNEFLSMAERRHLLADVMPKPNPEKWLNYYRNHRLLMKEVCLLMGMDTEGDECSVIDLLDEMRGLSRLAKRDRAQAETKIRAAIEELGPEGTQELLRGCNEGWAELMQIAYAEAASDTELSDEDEEEIEPFMMSQAGGFFFRVWMPCWVIHQELPGKIYSRARRGDTESLNALLRLDKVLLLDQSVMRHVVDSAYGRWPRHYDDLTKAIGGRPRGNRKNSKLKRKLAALVAQWSSEAGHPINSAEIRRLFDILAMSDGRLVDTDITGSPEVFAKGVQREKNWPTADPDKS